MARKISTSDAYRFEDWGPKSTEGSQVKGNAPFRVSVPLYTSPKTENKANYSQKLKNLLERNSRKVDTNDDPYIFNEFDHVDMTLPTSTAVSGPASQNDHKNVYFSNGFNTNGCRAASSLNKMPSYAFANSQSSDNAIENNITPNLTHRVKHVNSTSSTMHSANLRPPDKHPNIGKSFMSRLAIAKIEKTIESRGKNLQKPNNSFQKTATTSKLPPKTLYKHVSLTSIPTKCNVIVPKKDTISQLRAESVESSVKIGAPAVLPVVNDDNGATLRLAWNLRNEMRLIKRKYDQHLADTIGIDIALPNEAELNLMQKHWFSLCHDYNSFMGPNRKRETKLAQLKTELKHKLAQYQVRHRDGFQQEMGHFLIRCARNRPNLAAFLIDIDSRPGILCHRSARCPAEVKCGYKMSKEDAICEQPVLPDTPFCPLHITHHPTQHLFSMCSALTTADVKCGLPALGHLCLKHRGVMGLPTNISQGIISVKSIPMRRHRSANTSNRAKKRKRHQVKEKDYALKNIGYVAPQTDVGRSADAAAVTASNTQENVDVQVEVGEDLTISTTELPLDSTVLATLDTHALEEADLNQMLNHISPEAFNDLLTDKYATETEELERALEAVNNDTLKLLNMLDPETLAALPEIMKFPNAPIEQTYCDGPLFIPPHTDMLQS